MSNLEQSELQSPGEGIITVDYERLMREAKEGHAEAVREPAYKSEMDPTKRAEIIMTSAEICRAIPSAIIMGGNALRLQYEAKTGKPMFGAGKADHDIFVPREQVAQLDHSAPEGFAVSQHPDFHKPEQGYIVLVELQNQEHVDVFGRGDGKESEELEVDGENLKTLSVGELIADKLALIDQTDGLKKLDEADRLKHIAYTQRLLEIVDAIKDPDQLDSDLETIGQRAAEMGAKEVDDWKSRAEANDVSLKQLVQTAIQSELSTGIADSTAQRVGQRLDFNLNGEEFEGQLRQVVPEERTRIFSGDWRERLEQVARG